MAWVLQGNVLKLHLYTADIPISGEITIATFADDTTLLFTHVNYIASFKLHPGPDAEKFA